MTLYKKYRLWKKANDEKRWHTAYFEGYGWCWAAHMIAALTIDEIEAKTHGSTHPFDKGANAAVTDIIKSGL